MDELDFSSFKSGARSSVIPAGSAGIQAMEGNLSPQTGLAEAGRGLQPRLERLKSAPTSQNVSDEVANPVAPSFYLKVSIPAQTLELVENGEAVKTYPVSTAKNGPGERKGSGCTPRGWHVIRAKIGGNTPENAVFIGRRWTGEIYGETLQAQFPERDWILTRILWLGGLEPGFNRYGEVDTAWRYIYIHGSPDHGVTGIPQSHGCVRMRNAELLDLFGRVGAGTNVFIEG